MNDLSLTTHADAPPTSVAVMMNPGALQALVAFAEMMAKSNVTVPEHLKGKPADCMAIAMQAAQWGMNPFAVAQKTHIVSGRLGYEAQLVNAVVQSSGAITGAFSYEYTGDGQTLACRVGAVLRGDTAITWGEWLRSSDVQTKNSPLWKVNPKQQLGYLQVKNWARLYCPGAILGVYSTDELEDTGAAPAGPRHMGEVDEVPRSGPRRKSEALPPAAAPAPKPDADGVIDAPTAASPTPAPAPVTVPAGGITGNQVAYLRKKLRSAGLGEPAVCDRFQVTGIELLNVEQFDELKAELLQMV